MTDDRILDAEEVVKLLPTQAALIRLGKSHEALREQLHATQTERDQERRNSDAAVALLATAEARIVAAEARVAALTQALRDVLDEAEHDRGPERGNAPGHAHKDPPYWDGGRELCTFCLAWVAARAVLASSGTETP